MECIILCEMDTELTQKQILRNTNRHMHTHAYVCFTQTHTETVIPFIQLIVCLPLTSYFLYFQSLIF